MQSIFCLELNYRH